MKNIPVKCFFYLILIFLESTSVCKAQNISDLHNDLFTTYYDYGQAGVIRYMIFTN